jgi:CheY-like chemotaxis protein
MLCGEWLLRLAGLSSGRHSPRMGAGYGLCLRNPWAAVHKSVVACMANNTILIVDDDPQVLAYYWQLFEGDDGAKFDVLGEDRPRRHRLLCHRLGDSVKFVEMFDGMVRMDRRHPLCIIDMQMPGEDGRLDKRRGLQTARRVREIDPGIHIVICTAAPDVGPEEVREHVTGSAHFFRRPFSPEQESEFCLTIHGLVDEWNGRS